MKDDSAPVYLIFFWCVVLYLFFFQPIVSKYLYLGIEVILAFIFFLRNKQSASVFFKKYRIELLFSVIICSYSLLIDIIHGEIVYSDRFLSSFFQSYVVSFVIISLMIKRGVVSHLKTILVIMCFIACGITILAILVPSVGSFTIEYATQDVKEWLVDRQYAGLRYRTYGLSESLNFTYPYVLAVIGAYLLTDKIKVYTPILLLMIFVAIIFNARIAFVPLIISFVYLLFFKEKRINGFITYAFIIIVSIVLFSWTIKMYPELMNSWGLGFWNDMSNFFSGDDESTIGTLTGSMWVIPDNELELIFGSGKSIFNSSVASSDVGYILQLNYGGIILLITIFIYYIYISRRIIQKLSFRHWFPILFIVSIFVLNFKGFYLAALPGCRFMTFLYIYYIYTAQNSVNRLNSRQEL